MAASTHQITHTTKEEAVESLLPSFNIPAPIALPYSKTLTSTSMPKLTPVADFLPAGQRWSRGFFKLKSQSLNVPEDVKSYSYPLSPDELYGLLLSQAWLEQKGAFIIRESKQIGQFVTFKAGNPLPMIIYEGLIRFKTLTSFSERQEITKEAYTVSFRDKAGNEFANIDGSGAYISIASKMAHLPDDEELENYTMPAEVKARIARPSHKPLQAIFDGGSKTFAFGLYHPIQGEITTREIILGTSYGVSFFYNQDILPCFLDKTTFAPVDTTYMFAKTVTWRLYDETGRHASIKLTKERSDASCAALINHSPVIFPGFDSSILVISEEGREEIIVQREKWQGRGFFVSHHAKHFPKNDPRGIALYLQNVATVKVRIQCADTAFIQEVRRERIAAINEFPLCMLLEATLEQLSVGAKEIAEAKLDIINETLVIETPRTLALVDYWLTAYDHKREMILAKIAKYPSISTLENIATSIEQHIHQEEKLAPSMPAFKMAALGAASGTLGGVALFGLMGKALIATTIGATVGGVAGSMITAVNEHTRAKADYEFLLEHIHNRIKQLRATAEGEHKAQASHLGLRKRK